MHETEGERVAPPIATLLTRTLEGVGEDGSATLGFMGQPSFCNADGAPQGGIVSAMLDATLGHALRTELPENQRFVTLELSARFVRPALPGCLIGHAHVVHRGRSVAVILGDLRDIEGKLLAHGTLTKMIVAVMRSRNDEASPTTHTA